MNTDLVSQRRSASSNVKEMPDPWGEWSLVQSFQKFNQGIRVNASIPLLTHGRRLLIIALIVLAQRAWGQSVTAFPQSVASGDPKSDSVILWTRLSPPEGGSGDLTLQLEVATDGQFQNVVLRRNDLLAREAFDHCVKVKATGLSPYTTYFYRFQWKGLFSPVGRTRTAPLPDQAVAARFAVLNCQDYIGRYFNTLAHLVATESNQLDFVVHLGDFIYETTGSPAFQTPGEDRSILFEDFPGALLLGSPGSGFYAAASLSNYRQLYRTVLTDPSLQKLRELFPVVHIWDDHEFANDAWGAHATDDAGRTPGLEPERRRHAEQAFFEFVPLDVGLDDQGVRIDSSQLFPNAKIYRNLNYGSQLDLFLTDYRSYRPDHLIPEDAFPGTIAIEEPVLSQLFGSLWPKAKESLDPYVDIDLDEMGVLHDALVSIVTPMFVKEGFTLERARICATHAIAGKLSTTYINALMTAAGQPAPFPPSSLATLPRGLSFLFLGKQSLFSEFGSRYLVPRDTYRLYAAYRAQLDPSSQDAYGPAQTAALASWLTTTPSRWKVVANSVSFAPLGFDFSHPPFPLPGTFPASLKVNLQLNADDWDGFPDGRETVLNLLGQKGAVVISGDIHASFITRHKTTSGGSVAEFTAPAASSQTFRQEILDAALGNPATAGVQGIRQLIEASDLLLKDSMDRGGQARLIGARTDANGYVVMQVTGDALVADYRHTSGTNVFRNLASNPATLAAAFDSRLYKLSTTTNDLTLTPLDTVLKVAGNLYSPFATTLTNGSWVYVDADPAAGSPLRATQRSLGYREVDYKAAVYPTLSFAPVAPVTNATSILYDYSAQSAKTATVGFWANKDLPILIGPDGNAYITDGHHTTAGYLAPTSPVREIIPGLRRVVLGHIVANYYNPVLGPQPLDDTWWTARAAENNALLYGVDGNVLTLPGEPDYASLQPILPSSLPMPTTPSNLTTNGVTAMLNSLMRGLSWALADGVVASATDSLGKKIVGYKKSAPGSSVDINFVEFYWGDYLRNRIVWDDSKQGSPLGAAQGDGSVTRAPLSFFAAAANGIALVRSEVYRDQYGRRLIDYTNSTLFNANTLNWARGSLSNGLAGAGDTYHLYLLDDSHIVGDISPSAVSTNLLHINTSAGRVLSNTLQNISSLLVNDGPQLKTSWKDTTVSNSTLRFPAGQGTLVIPSPVKVTQLTQLGAGVLSLQSALTSPRVLVQGGTLAGAGTILGSVDVASAGTLAPGGDQIGALSLQGSVTLQGTVRAQIRRDLAGALTSDTLVGISNVVYGGQLRVEALEESPLALGDRFRIFDALQYAGSFAEYVLPPLATGLAWDTSRLPIDGSIEVGSANAVQPVLAGVSPSFIADQGTSPVLTGGAFGSEPITYQWTLPGGALTSSSSNASLTLAAVQKSQQGIYQLVASNGAGSSTSAPVVLKINQAPTAQPVLVQSIWKSSFPLTLSGTDPDGDPLTFTLVSQPSKGTITGKSPSLTYTPSLGASGTDTFTYKANDGRLDSAPVTITFTLQGTVNQGLVGVGRIPADSFDARGPGIDTLGGIGSGAFFDSSTWERTGDDASGYSYKGVLYATPDRGFGDGGQSYLPRVETLGIQVTPYYGTSVVSQTQIILTNTATLLLSDENGSPMTGADADDLGSTLWPTSSTNSIGGGRRSLDAEGVVRTSDGGYFISDEYGPFIYRFDATGKLDYALRPPEALIPKIGAYPGTNYFSATNAPLSGRRNNRGLEGLSLTPDGKRLFTVLQSPTIQDGGAGNGGRNTRILVFDIDPDSVTYRKPIAEYLYVLTLNGTAQTNRNTPISEILALNRQQVLLLERDGQGLGTGTNVPATYKRVVLASTVGASNIINTGYDLERSAPGQLSLPGATLPAGITPMQRFDLVDLIDPAQLARFGLNNSTNQDSNSISEKWESLALMPLKDPVATNDFLLLVMNDNDFKASIVYHNGVAVGTNNPSVDNMMLAYRVSLPTFGAPVPPNLSPTISLTAPTNAVLASPVNFTVTANANDPDGLITKVQFWSGGQLVAEDATFPFQFAVAQPPLGLFSLQAVAFDNEGASVTSAVYQVTIQADNLPPTVTLTSPTNNAAFNAPANFPLAAVAGDVDGLAPKVELYRGTTKLATLLAPPYSLAVSNQPLGTSVYRAVATDSQGLSSTSAPVQITVTKNLQSPALTLQILHASDLEAGIDAVKDAPAFSAVVSALKAEFPTNTLILSSGDNYIPGPFFNAAGDPLAKFGGVAGRGDIAILNAIGFQAAAFGNHEFDAGTAQIRSLLVKDAASGYAGTLFPYLSANLDFGPDSSLSGLVAGDGLEASSLANRIARSAVITVAGQKIGVVGVTTPDLRTISSPGAVGVNPQIVGAVQAAVDALLPLGVNKVIVLSHLQQYALEFDLAKQLRDVDVVIAGGSHSIFAKPSDPLRSGDVASENYPVNFTSASNEPVLVVNCGPNYRYVGRLVLTFGANGLITAVAPSSGAYATDAAGLAKLGNPNPNSTVLTVATNLGAILIQKDGQLFGRTRVYLNGLRSSVRTEESNLGDLSADANLWRGRQADPRTSLSIKNGGGIRDSIGAVLSLGGDVSYVPPLANKPARKKSGQISQLDIENALRFNNALSLLTVTAQQLRDALEWGVAAVAPGATPGQFPQVSGIWFSFDPARDPMTYQKAPDGSIVGIATPGSRVRTLVATRADNSLDLVVQDGQLVGDSTRTFRLVTLDFMAGGGDSYYPLTQATERLDIAAPGGRSFETEGGEQWALAQYLKAIQVYNRQDTPAAFDLRIQNLQVREDWVTRPILTSIIPGIGTAVRFTTLEGGRYEVWSATEVDGPWKLLTPAPILGSGSEATFLDSTPPEVTTYYKVIRLD